VAAAGPGSSVVSNRWNFGTDTVPGIRVTFAAKPGGPFLGQPPAAGIRFVQVSATAAVPMHFLPAVPAIARRQTITATAVAGQTELREIRDGMTPLYAVRLIR
jgi:hypothetical protein